MLQRNMRENWFNSIIAIIWYKIKTKHLSTSWVPVALVSVRRTLSESRIFWELNVTEMGSALIKPGICTGCSLLTSSFTLDWYCSIRSRSNLHWTTRLPTRYYAFLDADRYKGLLMLLLCIQGFTMMKILSLYGQSTLFHLQGTRAGEGKIEASLVSI